MSRNFLGRAALAAVFILMGGLNSIFSQQKSLTNLMSEADIILSGRVVFQSVEKVGANNEVYTVTTIRGVEAGHSHSDSVDVQFYAAGGVTDSFIVYVTHEMHISANFSGVIFGSLNDLNSGYVTKFLAPDDGYPINSDGRLYSRHNVFALIGHHVSSGKYQSKINQQKKNFNCNSDESVIDKDLHIKLANGNYDHEQNALNFDILAATSFGEALLDSFVFAVSYSPAIGTSLVQSNGLLFDVPQELEHQGFTYNAYDLDDTTAIISFSAKHSGHFVSLSYDFSKLITGSFDLDQVTGKGFVTTPEVLIQHASYHCNGVATPFDSIVLGVPLPPGSNPSKLVGITYD